MKTWKGLLVVVQVLAFVLSITDAAHARRRCLSRCFSRWRVDHCNCWAPTQRLEVPVEFYGVGEDDYGTVGLTQTKRAALAAELADLRSTLQTFRAELACEFPFRVGMTTAQVAETINLNRRRFDERSEELVRPYRKDKVLPPRVIEEAYGKMYLYCAPEEDDDRVRNGSGSITFWVTGKARFWVDMAVRDGRVENIWITPGTGKSLYPISIRMAGSGQHVGKIAETLKTVKERLRENLAEAAKEEP